MTFLLMGLGRYGLVVSAVAGLLVTVAAWRAVDVSKQRAIGETRAVARIEKATDNAIEIGTKAAAKSAAAVPRRVQPKQPPPGYVD